jgi:hypothetical protein
VSITLGIAPPGTRRRHALGTEPGDVVRNARAYAALGVDTLVISANTSDPAQARAALEMVAREVAGAV